MRNLPDWHEIHTLIFDFDGVFTDNKVIIDELGKESVVCSREDGLGIDLIKKFSKENSWELDLFILSKEKNCVVKKRAEKLRIKCYSGVDNKLQFIKNYLKEKFPGDVDSKKGIIYLGNDINDLEAMLFVGYSVAPKDAHPKILTIANSISIKKGGDGFVRKFIEDLIKI